MNIGARIAQIHTYLPETKLTNQDLSRLFPKYSEEDILRKSGIHCRHVRKESETASDLAVTCGRQLFEKSPGLKEEIDMLLYVTSALDYVGPATACLIHEQLGLNKRAGSMDLPMGCSGFTNALAVAKALIESGQATKILLITADIPTSVLHPDDFYLRVLFSDAACCTVVERCETQKIGQFSFGTDGGGAECLIIRGSGARDPVDQAWIDKYEEAGGLLIGRMEMQGDKILAFSLREVPPTVGEILEKHDLTLDDLDWVVFHQASGLILKFVAKKLKIPPSKMYSALESVGNTVAATIPIALQIGIDKGDLKEGQKILLCGFGIGFSWSGTILEL